MIRRFRDFAAAEDAVQEALFAAARQWPTEGLPDNPRGWLLQVASRRMVDHFRSEASRRRREGEVVGDQWTDGEPSVSPPDEAIVEREDSLILLFMCCHPALTRSSAIALTLRAVGGLTTAEIAHAYMVPEATMAQRISRAKQRIKESGVAFRMPESEERGNSLAAVLHVLYLMFNEGYATSAGPALQRRDVAREAIRLTRGVSSSLPDDPEVTGLLALMLLTDSRHEARSSVHGELIPLDEQDRTRWNREAIAEGLELITRAWQRGSVGVYQVQAAIAAVHSRAPSMDATDWEDILGLYGVLRRLSNNPMVELNHAIAAAMVHGPANGLALLNELDQGRLAGHYRIDAVRAHLLERQGALVEAVRFYLVAAEKTANTSERDYLVGRAARIETRA